MEAAQRPCGGNDMEAFCRCGLINGKERRQL